MGKFENLIGQKCKSWIVVSRAEDSFDPSGRKRIRWLCKCENCGAEKISTSQMIKNGQVSACEKCNTSRNLEGQRFGKVVAIKRVDDHISQSGFHSIQWLCRCDCGKEFITRASYLKKGLTTSCGCAKEKDLCGKRFGRLTVVKRADDRIRSNGKRDIRWECICDCGNKVIVLSSCLKSGYTKSCGCLKKEVLSTRNKIHGFSVDGKERLYDVWSQMKLRCNNPKNKSYKNYGGRGIKVCKEWLDDYAAFREWAYNNGYDENAPRCQCTIDRIDNDGDYCPENCRFVDYNIQMNNRRSNHLLSFNNETHTMTEWAEITGLDFRIIQNRIKLGWSVEKTLTTPVLERYKHDVRSTTCTQ